MRQRRIRNGYGCTVDFDDEETKFLARMIGGLEEIFLCYDMQKSVMNFLYLPQNLVQLWKNKKFISGC